MPTVHVNLDKRNYPIVVGNEILKDIGDSLQNFEAISKIAIVINPLVASFHLKSVKESLLNKGFKVSVIIVPDGEKFKDYRQL
ncbi:MAG: 3-dehydroquinate synthase, partial [Candidatus Omnitrophica bacterium]|nr:3-dehydroquinate synthase [Candidatus Omnitrophota bacterium]